ncbi:MAG: TolC family protein [Alphaproteobacteria bacterium]|nr:TolC family protein [Alphaproteobacteria bacterium]
MKKSILFLLGLTACTVQNDPLTDEQIAARVQLDRTALFENQEAIVKPVTLYEAMARAIKYNAQNRVEIFEQALNINLDGETVDMLPELAASGGWTTRSNRVEYRGVSEPKNHDKKGVEHDFKGNKTFRDADLQMVFNVLDFGVSYYNAKQAGNQSFIAQENIRKIVQHLVHDVRVAFWRAAAAQRIEKDLETLSVKINEELIRINTDGNKTTEQLTSEKSLLSALQNLNKIKQEILTAKLDLAKLMNVGMNSRFVLDIPREMDIEKISKAEGLYEWEYSALLARPELRIHDYEVRLSEYEAKKEIVKLFPGISFGGGINYQSDTFLKNKNWAEVGVGVSWNLINLITAPGRLNRIDSEKELARQQRLAMTMAIISQVNIAHLQINQSIENFNVNERLRVVNENLMRQVAKKTKDRSALLLAMVDAIQSQINRDLAYAEYKMAESDMFIALGWDPVNGINTSDVSVAALADVLESNLSRDAGDFPYKDVSYDYPPSQRSQFEVFGNLNENQVKADKPAQPISLKPTMDQLSTPKKVEKPVVVKKSKTVKAKPVSGKMLQVSSFETLEGAQAYWNELSGTYPNLSKYSPIYREVKVNNQSRVRTFISDAEKTLRELCKQMAADLKSCLLN